MQPWTILNQRVSKKHLERGTIFFLKRGTIFFTWLSDKLPNSSAIEIEAAVCRTFRPAITPPLITWACRSSFSSFNLRVSSRKFFSSASISFSLLIGRSWMTSLPWTSLMTGGSFRITSSAVVRLSCSRRVSTCKKWDTYW